MPELRRCVVWSVVFGLVSYVAYYQLQETMVTFTEIVIVPAKRRDVSEQFFERPQAFSDFHPYGIGVSNVQRTMNEKDPQQIEELRYTIHEKMPSPFGLPGDSFPDIDCKFEFIEPDAIVKSSARSEDRFGLIKFRMNGTFLLADYKSKKESGTVLIDSTSFIGPRVVVTRIFLANAQPAHRKQLDNLREFFSEKATRVNQI